MVQNEVAFSLGHGFSICGTSYVKCSQKLGEQSLSISRIVEKKPVKKAGKNEHHLWKKRDSAGSGQEALDVVRVRIQHAETKSAKNDGRFVPRESKKKKAQSINLKKVVDMQEKRGVNSTKCF